MSGQSTGRKPDTDAQWARDVEQRLRHLESRPSAMRVGSWVIADRDGELVATTTDGRRVDMTKLDPVPENTATPLAAPSPTRSAEVSSP